MFHCRDGGKLDVGPFVKIKNWHFFSNSGCKEKKNREWMKTLVTPCTVEYVLKYCTPCGHMFTETHPSVNVSCCVKITAEAQLNFSCWVFVAETSGHVLKHIVGAESTNLLSWQSAEVCVCACVCETHLQWGAQTLVCDEPAVCKSSGCFQSSCNTSHQHADAFRLLEGFDNPSLLWS